MPELPEVQTTANDLQKVLHGLKIQNVWSDHKKAIKLPKSFPSFKKSVVGRKILKVGRRGKNILIFLSDNKILLVHQKMTGHLLYGEYQMSKHKVQTNDKKTPMWFAVKKGPMKDDSENRFIHLVFSLSNGKQLALCDMRKFAKVALFPTNNQDEIPDIKKLGPEPFGENFTLKHFSDFSKSKRRPIKTLLMDQTFFAGVGNIYSDEILWVAGVHPMKTANKLTSQEIKKIYQAIKSVLSKAIEAKGNSYSDYRTPSGKRGLYQKIQNAYQKTGTKCKKKDGGIIKKIKIGGRSAHFCPLHQTQ